MTTRITRFTALVLAKAEANSKTISKRVIETANVHANRVVRTYNALRRQYGRFNIQDVYTVTDIADAVLTAVVDELGPSTPLSEWDDRYVQAVVSELDYFLWADPSHPANEWFPVPPFLEEETVRDTLWTNTFVTFVQRIGAKDGITLNQLTEDPVRSVLWQNIFADQYRRLKKQVLLETGYTDDGKRRVEINLDTDYYSEDREMEFTNEFGSIREIFDQAVGNAARTDETFFRTNTRFPDGTRFNVPEDYFVVGAARLTPAEREQQAIWEQTVRNWTYARNLYARFLLQSKLPALNELTYDDPPDAEVLRAYHPDVYKRPQLKKQNGEWIFRGPTPPFGKPPAVNESPEAQAWKQEWEAKSPEEREFDLKKAELTARSGSLNDRAARDREEFSKLSLEEQAGATNMFEIRQHEYHLQFLDLQQELDYLEHRRINVVQQPEEYQASFRKLTEKNEEREKSRKELQQKIRKLRGEPEEPPPLPDGEGGIDADTDPAQTPQYTGVPSSSGGDMEDDDYNLPPPGAFNPWYRFRGTGGMGHGYPERLRKSRVGNWTGAPRPRYPTVNRPYTSNPWSRFIGNRTHITRMHSLGYDQDIVRSHPSPPFVAPHAALGQRGAPQTVDAVCPTLAPGVRHYLFG